MNQGRQVSPSSIVLKFLVIFTVSLISSGLCAQVFEPNEEHDHSHDHANDPDAELGHHHHHKNEIGIANSPVYFVKEKEFAYGLHIHYLRKIGNSKFALGAGYERIFDEHKHNTFGLVAAYRPSPPFSINLSPGLTTEANSKGAAFALHIETAYEFEIKDIHLGPAFEFAYDPEDIHLSIGLHIGLGF